MVAVRVCSKLKITWKSVDFTNKVWKNSRYFVGVFNKTIISLALVGYEMIFANSYPAHTRGITREFTQRRRRRWRERQKAIGLDNKTTTLLVHHGFLYISLPSLHEYNLKVTNFTFSRGREQKTTTFFFFFWTLMQSFRIQLQKELPTFDQLNEME